MKTTLELPAALLMRAKRYAAAEGVTMADLIVAGLEAELARRDASSVLAFTWATTGGMGLKGAANQIIEVAYGQ